MQYQVRTKEPTVLVDHGSTWTDDYTGRRRLFSGPFRWPTHDGVPLNQLLLPLLASQTARHCSYCDGFPIGPQSRETIDHFESKVNSPALAFDWGNLFYCCDQCQQKDVQSGGRPLKPDEPSYKFEEYFIVDFSTGELQPNPTASSDKRTMATDTITVLRLNARGLPEDRLRELDRNGDELTEDFPLSKRAYRFLYS